MEFVALLCAFKRVSDCCDRHRYSREVTVRRLGSKTVVPEASRQTGLYDGTVLVHDVRRGPSGHSEFESQDTRFFGCTLCKNTLFNIIRLSEQEIQVAKIQVASVPAAVSAEHCVG